mgnify:CR=1 FL=1
MRKIFFLGFFISCFTFYGQHKINNYKYVVVDAKFDFLKQADQYQTSSLTKFLFNKYGFTSFLNTEQLHTDISTNRCTSLFASVKNESSMLTTKVILVLKDCSNNIIYKSSIGKSKEKEYKKAYHEAIRNAFKDPVIKNHSFTGKLPKQAKVPKTPKVIPNKNITKKTISSAQNVLYAQANANGFQLVDTTPKVVFSILKTEQNTVFIIKDKNGILYQKASNWIAEYYENGVLVKKVYQVRF